MARKSAEEIRRNRIAAIEQRYRCLRLPKCVRQTALVFQKLVRLRALEQDGKLTCVSCGKRDFPGKGFDSGHWIGRSAASVIFDSRNVHPQCVSCNQYGAGPVKANYDAWMRENIGQEAMDELIRLSKQTKEWTREELAELRQTFLDEIRQIEQLRAADRPRRQ